ncbi:MAG: hypothetical protein M1826_004339 [Phylliscum demangeonii]|nr:MAG: hypothetical protein M1826_004339 [Phylliscum demangeonii]
MSRGRSPLEPLVFLFYLVAGLMVVPSWQQGRLLVSLDRDEELTRVVDGPRYMLHMFRLESDQPAVHPQCQPSMVGCLDDTAQVLVVDDNDDSSSHTLAKECGQFFFQPTTDNAADAPSVGTLWQTSLFMDAPLRCGALSSPSHKLACHVVDKRSKGLAPDIVLARQGTTLVWKWKSSPPPPGPGSFARTWFGFKSEGWSVDTLHAVQRANAPAGAVEYSLRLVRLQ